MNLNPFQRQQTESTNEEVTDFSEIRDTFIQYIESESSLLEIDDFSRNEYEGQFIGYNCGYKNRGTHLFGGHDIFLSARLSFQNDVSNGILTAALVFKSDSEYIQSHYEKMQEDQTKIEQCFFLEGIDFEPAGIIHRIKMEKRCVDLSDRENWQTEFQWLRENLEKLYYVLRIYNILG